MDEDDLSVPAPIPNPKMVNRLVSMKHKFETAKLRDLLREKCRIRAKTHRGKSFDIDREKAWVADMLKKELEENILLEDVVYQELLEESYQWLVDQYEKELEYYATKDPNEVIAICPICQLSELTLENQMFRCACGVHFWYRQSVEHFCDQMKNVVALHENKCDFRLIFFLEPKITGQVNLVSMCDKCDYYAEIVN